MIRSALPPNYEVYRFSMQGKDEMLNYFMFATDFSPAFFCCVICACHLMHYGCVIFYFKWWRKVEWNLFI